MEDVCEIIFMAFSDKKVQPDSEYKKVFDQFVEADSRFTKSLNQEQRQNYQELIQLNNELQISTEQDLIKFVLTFVSNVFNYNQNKF